MLQRARRRLPDVECKAIDVRSLDQVFETRFDAVISVGNALPMLPRGQLPIAASSHARVPQGRRR